jgi:hypothetical protein
MSALIGVSHGFRAPTLAQGLEHPVNRGKPGFLLFETAILSYKSAALFGHQPQEFQ